MIVLASLTQESVAEAWSVSKRGSVSKVEVLERKGVLPDSMAYEKESDACG